jgi:hypothetical protein
VSLAGQPATDKSRTTVTEPGSELDPTAQPRGPPTNIRIPHPRPRAMLARLGSAAVVALNTGVLLAVSAGIADASTPGPTVATVGGWHVSPLTMTAIGVATAAAMASTARAVITKRAARRAEVAQWRGRLTDISIGPSAEQRRARPRALGLVAVLGHLAVRDRLAGRTPRSFTGADVAAGFANHLNPWEPDWLRTRVGVLSTLTPEQADTQLGRLAHPRLGLLESDPDRPGYRLSENLVTILTTMRQSEVPFSDALLRDPLTSALLRNPGVVTTVPWARLGSWSDPTGADSADDWPDIAADSSAAYALRRAIRDARFVLLPDGGATNSAARPGFADLLRQIRADRRQLVRANKEVFRLNETVLKANRAARVDQDKYGVASAAANAAEQTLDVPQARLSDARQARDPLDSMFKALIQNARDAGAAEGLGRGTMSRRLDSTVLGLAALVRNVAPAALDVWGTNVAQLGNNATHELAQRLPGLDPARADDQVTELSVHAQLSSSLSLLMFSLFGDRLSRNMGAIVASALVTSGALAAVGLWPTIGLVSLLWYGFGPFDAGAGMARERLRIYFSEPEFQDRRDGQLATATRLLSAAVPSLSVLALTHFTLPSTFIGGGLLYAASALGFWLALRGGHTADPNAGVESARREIRHIISAGWLTIMGTPGGLRLTLFSVPTLAFLTGIAPLFASMSNRLLHMNTPGWSAAAGVAAVATFPWVLRGVAWLAGLNWPALLARLGTVGTDENGDPIISKARALMMINLLQLPSLAATPLLWHDPNFVTYAAVYIVQAIFGGLTMTPLLSGWQLGPNRTTRTIGMRVAGLAAALAASKALFNNADEAVSRTHDVPRLLDLIHNGNWLATAPAIPATLAMIASTLAAVHYHGATLNEFFVSLKRLGVDQETRDHIEKVLSHNRIADMGWLRHSLQQGTFGTFLGGYRRRQNAALRDALGELGSYRDIIEKAIALTPTYRKRGAGLAKGDGRSNRNREDQVDPLILVSSGP